MKGLKVGHGVVVVINAHTVIDEEEEQHEEENKEDEEDVAELPEDELSPQLSSPSLSVVPLSIDQRKRDHAEAQRRKVVASAAGRSTAARPTASRDDVIHDVLQAVLPKMIEVQQSLLEPIRHLISSVVDDGAAMQFGCRSCEELTRQLQSAKRPQGTSYDTSRLRGTPSHLRGLLPNVKEVLIKPDGLCSLRAIAVGLYSSLTDEEEELRVIEVRQNLLDELQRWTIERWMNMIPGYGVRELVVDNLVDDDMRTSFDIYKEYLSDPTHQRTHLDHAIFYLASSFYHVEFFIVAHLSQGGRSSSLYHRRINLVADSRRTIVVSHSFEHYNLLDIKADDIASLATLLQLPQHVQTSRWTDRDWCRWKDTQRKHEIDVNETASSFCSAADDANQVLQIDETPEDEENQAGEGKDEEDEGEASSSSEKSSKRQRRLYCAKETLLHTNRQLRSRTVSLITSVHQSEEINDD
jgi:hypothetical protein